MTDRSLSLRDPAGSLFRFEGRLLRLVTPEGSDNLKLYKAEPVLSAMRESRELVDYRLPGPDEKSEIIGSSAIRKWSAELPFDIGNGELIEHSVIPFVTHPFEWPAEMLHDAGLLTLKIAKAVSGSGMRLKDAAADNVLFWDGRAVFVDALSFERRPEGSPLWPAADQFVRSFILPLLAYRDFGLSPPTAFAVERSGPSPKDLYQFYSVLRRFSPTVLRYVTLPTWLEGKGKDDELYTESKRGSEEKAAFVFQHLLNRFERTMMKLAPRDNRRSAWSEYTEDNSYTDDTLGRKEAFIREAAGDLNGKIALDVGCNTGHFSALMAALGASVIAIDSDPVVVGSCWRRAKRENIPILPLIQNIARPTPGTGWRNQEKESFLDRIGGTVDFCVLLAVLHHIMVTEGIPLARIVDLMADLTKRDTVVEFVPRDDPMFRRIARGRDELYKWFDRESFEAACNRRFNILSVAELSEGGRRLYHLRRKEA